MFTYSQYILLAGLIYGTETIKTNGNGRCVWWKGNWKRLLAYFAGLKDGGLPHKSVESLGSEAAQIHEL